MYCFLDHQQCGCRFFMVLAIFYKTSSWPHMGSRSKHQSVHTKTDRGLGNQQNCYYNEIFKTGTFLPWVSDRTKQMRVILYTDVRSCAVMRFLFFLFLLFFLWSSTPSTSTLLQSFTLVIPPLSAHLTKPNSRSSWDPIPHYHKDFSPSLFPRSGDNLN